ncbi:MAG: hypothetical protein QG582_1347, partial [Candidatus Thermoplasmatota archaeon]|nr:hypothetical protein [Candidatus Thermoplasmatota archaeon]
GLIEIVRKMRERKLEPGRFEVFDGDGAPLGAMDFTNVGPYHVRATTVWGEVEVRTNADDDISITLDGGPVAVLVLSKWLTKLTLKLASGQEVVFKFATIANALRHKSELGRFEYKYKLATESHERAECTVTVAGSYSIRAEDIALAMLSFYGYQRVLVLVPWMERGLARVKKN